MGTDPQGDRDIGFVQAYCGSLLMHNALTALTLDVGIKGEECCARAFDAGGFLYFLG